MDTAVFEAERSRFLQFLEIARIVASPRDLDSILDDVSRQAAQLCDADRGSIFLWGTSGREGDVTPATTQLASGETQEEFQQRFRAQGPLKLRSQKLLQRVAQTRAPVIVEDARSSPDVSRTSVEIFGLRSVCGVPLMVEGQVIGALVFDNRHVRPFSEDQVEVARAVAEHLAFALRKALLLEETEKRLRQTEALYEIARAIASILELKPLLAKISREAARACDMDRCSLYLLEDGLIQPVMSQYADGRSEGEQWRAFKALGRMRVDEIPFVALTHENREALAIDDALQDPRVPESFRRFMVHNLLAVPLILHDDFLGTMVLDNTREPRKVAKEQINLASAIASQVALAVDNARLYEKTVRAETLRALADMAGGVAHDFNNLLAAILGRTQLMLRQMEVGAADNASQRQGLQIIEQVTRDGAGTVRRLLEFTRARTGLEEATTVDLNEILQQTVEVSRPRWKDEAEARGAAIDIVVETGNVPPTAGNPAELREVLLNLVINGIEAMPDGGTLRLATRREGDALFLEVSDTGVGMPLEVKRRVFDPFFTTKGPQASGLGLSVSYGIVQRHGGELTVLSEPESGSTFVLRLPYRQAPRRSPAPAPAPTRGNLKVLVIDDEPGVRQVLSEIVKTGGHDVQDAGGGEEGLEILAGSPFDVVLTDLGMPGMTGWEVAERVRERWPKMKIGLISGWGPQVETEKLEDHGVDFLCSKPFEIQNILETLAGIKAEGVDAESS